MNIIFYSSRAKLFNFKIIQLLILFAKKEYYL